MMCLVSFLDYDHHMFVTFSGLVWFYVITVQYLTSYSTSGGFGGHIWGGINSGVSFCNNSTVARVRWAFQVSQGSVETLFRWDGKRLRHFEANLLGKRCIKFHQNRPSFIDDITKKKHFGLSFRKHRISSLWNTFDYQYWMAVTS